MKCISPIRVKSAGRFTVFNDNGNKFVSEQLIVPCGQCIACRLNYGKYWSIRMMEELKHHDKACFATLTYDDEHLNNVVEDYGSPVLVKSDLQNFWKRLRKERKVRYFCCGEYGDRFGRPHYHAIIYGVSPDEVDLVAKHWQQGHIKLGTVTPDSCSYVAKYMTKKLRGHALAEQLEKDPDYKPEFVLMSRRPGIGAELSPDMQRFLHESGFVYRKGKKSSLPRYWKEKLDIHFQPEEVDFQEYQKHLTLSEKNDMLILKRLKFFGRF